MMLSLKKMVKTLIPLILIALLLVSCAEKNPYTGTWYIEGGNEDDFKIILRDNKTFEMSDGEGSLKGSYEINEGKIVFTIKEVIEENPVNDTIKAGDILECPIALKDNILSVSYDNETFKFYKK